MGENARRTEYNGLKHAEPTLPSYTYFDPGHHVRELSALWYRQWLYVCRSDSIANVGQWKTFQIGTQNILVVRDTDRTLRAYQNVCRHRGSVLCEGAAGQFKSKLITCPYHQWSYAYDGQLTSTTSHSEGDNFNKTDYPLYNVAIMEWRGCVLVCPAGEDDAPDFTDAFLRDADRLDNWPLEDLKLVHTWSKTMDCNWKVFWENFNECLHCPNIHPELSDLVPLYGRRIVDPKDAPGWHSTDTNPKPEFQGGLRDGAVSWTSDGQAQATPFETLTPAERDAGQTYIVTLPSFFIVGHLDYVRIVRVIPIGPEKTELHVEWLVHEKTYSNPSFDVSSITDFPILVMEQDATACELNQRGLRAISHKVGVLMPEEYYVHVFHSWVRERLGNLADKQPDNTSHA